MRIFSKFCALAVLVAALPAAAQEWPTKPVRLVVPYPAGGNVDTAARIVANKFEGKLGQPFVIENKPGAGGMIAGEFVAKADPDGYTFFVAANGPLLFSPVIFKRAAYDWKTDFVPVGSISFTPMVMQVHPSVPANNLQEFLALAKSKSLFMASPGAGTSNHLVSELLQETTGIKWETVHYRGNAPATQDLLGGQVQFNFDQVSVALPHIQAGKLRPLAVTASKRVSSLPDVPTFAEQGFPGFEATTFTGLFAPKGTPETIIARLNDALEDALKQKDVIDRFAALGAEARAMEPKDFFAYVQKEDEKWIPVIKRANITAE